MGGRVATVDNDKEHLVDNTSGGGGGGEQVAYSDP